MSTIGTRKNLLHYIWIISYLILLLIVAVAGWFATGFLGDKARQEIFDYNENALSLHVSHLGNMFEIIGKSAALLSECPVIVSAVASKEDHDIKNANAMLDRYNLILDSSVCYLMDRDGNTLASSNRNSSDSFIGKSYKFRPYFTQAMQGIPGRYFALGATSLKRGFYASYPVRDKISIIGVVVIKQDLDFEEAHMTKYPYCFVIDPNGIIFLSGKNEMKFKSLWPISQETQLALLKSKQFGDKSFAAVLPFEVEDRMEIKFEGKDYLVSRKLLNPEGWSIVLMTTTERIYIYKSVGVIITMLICAFILAPFIINYRSSKAAEKVRLSEEKLRFLTDNMTDIIWITDRNLTTTYVSPSIEKVLGFTPEERKKQSPEELMTPESLQRAQKMLLEELQRGLDDVTDENRQLLIDVEYYRKDGSTCWMENSVKAVWGLSGNLEMIYGVSRDITERKKAEEELDNSFKRLRAALGATIQAVAITVETRDPYTAGHQKRVADLSRAIATEMGLDINRTDGIRMAGVIHDLGKMAIPAEILSKPSKLSAIEYALIKTHSRAGYEILKDVGFPWPIAQIVLQHHERLNGSGYPAGLKGEEILLEARVIAVADVVEAIASYRPYRPSQGMEKALGEIIQNRGILYDSEVVDACLCLFREKGYKF